MGLPFPSNRPFGRAWTAAMDRSDPHLRILLVEDCPDTASTTRMILEIWGHEVRIAETGAAALRIAEAFQPNFILLDIGLPGRMDGFEVARRLRELRWDSAPVLVAATGFGGETVRKKAIEVGCGHFLTKPFDLGHLRAILSTLAVVPVAALI
jgi:CheY-like chemotaxis protein